MLELGLGRAQARPQRLHLGGERLALALVATRDLAQLVVCARQRGAVGEPVRLAVRAGTGVDEVGELLAQRALGRLGVREGVAHEPELG